MDQVTSGRGHSWIARQARRFGTAGLALSVALTAASALARPLEAVALGDRKVRVDGLLREWPGLDRLSTTVRGRAGDDPKVSGAVGYDRDKLYVAMKVTDRKLVRTRGLRRSEDHGVLHIAFPRGGGFKMYTVRLYAGETGKTAGAVKLGGRKLSGAKIVEAPTDGGYTLEASIPWSAFAEAKRLRAGMRAALQYADADRPGRVSAVVATAKGSTGASLPPLLLEGEAGLYHALIEKKGLPEKPAKVAAGDIAGNSQQEVVAVYGPFLTVVGADYREGKEFFFQDMGVSGASDVRYFDLRDLTGDGKDEIVLRLRVSDGDDGHREVLRVLSVSEGAEAPFVAFQHEVGVLAGEVKIRNGVSFRGRGKGASIVISQDDIEGVDPESYAEPLPGNMDSALLPWDSTKAVTFRWNGKTFEAVDEKTWDPPMNEPRGSMGTTTLGDSTGRSAAPAGPPPPRPPNADELLKRVYALYRKDRGVGPEEPRFDFVTDIAGDTTNERVVIHNKDIVVFGKGFKGGTSYAYITIGVEESSDVLHATARDLTGDGKAEIMVRGILHAKASEELGGEVVDRHAFFVYKATEGGIRRIFAAETGRSLGDDMVLAGVRFLPEGRGLTLELRPSRAVGWSEQSYPFPVDRHPYGGLEPLLLPWADMPPRRYQYDGEAYAIVE